MCRKPVLIRDHRYVCLLYICVTTRGAFIYLCPLYTSVYEENNVIINTIRSGLFQTANETKMLCQSSPYHTCAFYRVF